MPWLIADWNHLMVEEKILTKPFTVVNIHWNIFDSLSRRFIVHRAILYLDDGNAINIEWRPTTKAASEDLRFVNSYQFADNTWNNDKIYQFNGSKKRIGRTLTENWSHSPMYMKQFAQYKMSEKSKLTSVHIWQQEELAVLILNKWLSCSTIITDESDWSV